MHEIIRMSERAAVSLESLHGRKAKLHSLFHSACNIVCDNGDLICIQPEGSIFSPLSLVVKHGLPDMRNIPIGSEVFYSSEKKILSVAGTDFDLASSLCIPCRYVYRSPMSGNPEKLLSVMQRVYELGTKKQREIFESNVYKKCVTGIERVAAAIRSGDKDGAVSAALSLIGLGFGLTPTGDDMLTGFFAAARYDSQMNALAEKIRKPLIERALSATTAVSGAFLVCAMETEYSEVTAAVLDALYSGDETACLNACRDMLELGSTSGKDCLFGMLCAVRLLCKGKE